MLRLITFEISNAVAQNVLQLFLDGEKTLPTCGAFIPVLDLNESGKREKQSGQFLGRPRRRSITRSVRQSVRPFVSTRFVALSNLDLGCGGGEKRRKRGHPKQELEELLRGSSK